MNRAPNGHRWIDGKLFLLHTSFHGEGAKEQATELAWKLRKGEIPGHYGQRGKHYARVVRFSWRDMKYGEFDFTPYAVYSFPREG